MEPAAGLTSENFLNLADSVLRATGRGGTVSEPPQRDIIEVRDSDRVLQILAGPGSGKTEILIWRVLYELLVRNTESSRVLLTTFTRRAAQDLNVRIVERADALLEIARDQGISVRDPRVHDIQIGTIHSLCDTLLAEFDQEHLAEGVSVIDDYETRVRLARARPWLFKRDGRDVLEGLLGNEELMSLFRPPWANDWLASMGKVDICLALLNQHIETWIPRCEESGTPNGIEVVHGPAGLTEDLVFLQQQWGGHLRESHVLDFASLQQRFLDRQELTVGQLDHIFVDEFQDTNPIQYAIHLGWLNDAPTRVTVVGDDDQSIYRFRGSDIECFVNLRQDCDSRSIGFRQEVLSENWRSTRSITAFSRRFHSETVLKKLALPKSVSAPRGVRKGKAVRLLSGPWSDICATVAQELARFGAGRAPKSGDDPPPSAAILLFSTSEAHSRTTNRPALEIRSALEERAIRVYNPRNKVAGRAGSPVHDLLGLVSYLIDPVSTAPAGKNGRNVEVWASAEPGKREFATSAPPPFMISQAHASVQKRLIKSGGGRIGSPRPEIKPLLEYLDEIRRKLVAAATGRQKPRLTLSGLVARLLRMEPFRGSGFSIGLFRQALFTQLLEANVAATRQTAASLDFPMGPRSKNGKVEWPKEYWSFLNIFGALIEQSSLDDLEVESFSEHAVSLLTFHQAKGLEFDHVYVGLTGKDIDPSSALSTKLFSGETPDYVVDEGQPASTDTAIGELAEADREREIYVAITRPRESLTLLASPDDGRWAIGLNPGLAAAFRRTSRKTRSRLEIREFQV